MNSSSSSTSVSGDLVRSAKNARLKLFDDLVDILPEITFPSDCCCFRNSCLPFSSLPLGKTGTFDRDALHEEEEEVSSETGQKELLLSLSPGCMGPLALTGWLGYADDAGEDDVDDDDGNLAICDLLLLSPWTFLKEETLAGEGKGALALDELAEMATANGEQGDTGNLDDALGTESM